MKKILVILAFVLVSLFAADSTQVLEPSEEYLELTNDKFFFDNLKEFLSADSNGAYSPTKAFWFSIACPGLGQLYNRKPLKAAIYFSAEVYHIYQVFYYNDIYKHVKETQDYYGKTNWLALSKDQKIKQLLIIPDIILQ